MNRSRGILASLRLVNSVLSTRLSSAPSASTQVTCFSCLHLSFRPRSPLLTNIHQSLYFSTKPNSLLQLILTKDWSDELETSLDEFNSALTHETVIYVLKKLDKDPKKASHFFNWAREENGFSPNSSVFSFMLRILANKATMKEFWITLREMKELGFYLDEETYYTIHSCFKNDKMASDVVALTHFYKRMVEENAKDSIAQKVAKVILRDEWGNEIEKELDGTNIDLSDNLVIRVLKELRNYPKKVLQFFHWAGKCSNYKHNTVTYNALVRILARHDSIAEFWTVVEEMKGEGFEMDMDTYIKISRNFQKFRILEDAVKLYEFMMDGPFKPSEQDCRLLLRSISGVDAQDLSLVFRVVNKYEAAGFSLSKAIYDGIHRSLTRVGKFDKAAKIVESMKNAGCEPDNITYSQLVFGLCKARRLEEACKVLDEMEANGCRPDIKTWTILIKGHCDANQIDGALMCFSKMLKNFEADADLLDVLINGFVGQNRLDGAYKLLVEMVNVVHLRPWQATFKLLIEKLLGKGKLEESMNLLKLMKKHNYPPYPEPFIRYISKSGNVDDAKGFLKALSVKEYPSIGAYIHVLQSFLEEGRNSEAQDILYKCPHHIRNHPKVSELFGTKSTA
ncbi:Pentatricopeptide repeat-containing protein [Hibiscus syriacus]|uniref:Pentatricopeptide repeat-containing protein n=1 Tax=Hibiscus syriacus TaxID=106335 RepID=A0A6A2ZQH3_HIBSY|nr:pentatricopeptide repeat-containing protein At3g48250, chloroplastic-like [Hibiscus syriacus]KAE8694000.1 Pentatricopeptide repeat-containing protein [Hibiscus syriacus]